ncbi:MAG TPA: UDP-3-O-(3-hydroxymyristoyl)glucosamine N-acyltransferase [Gammaproteobacteria bacterium]
MSAKLAELAARFDCELRGDADLEIETVGTLATAGRNALSFLANPYYRDQLGRTAAGAVVLDSEFVDDCPAAALVSQNPYLTYARIADYLYPRAAPVPGVHATAVVAPGAVVPESSQVGPLSVVEAGAALGESVVIGPGCTVGADARIGDASVLMARATVLDRVAIGKRCVIHSGAVIGSDGFGFARDEAVWVRVPQLGSVRIGDDVSIGANTTIDRGAIEDTVIGDGVILDNLIQIGHNVKLGAHTAMAALCGISGSAVIGSRCMFAGAAVTVGHIDICDDVMVTIHSTVTRSITEPGTYSSTVPADDAARWRRNAARLRNLEELARRHRRIEKRIDEIADAVKDSLDDG